jgi:hypothetical protein
MRNQSNTIIFKFLRHAMNVTGHPNGASLAGRVIFLVAKPPAFIRNVVSDLTIGKLLKQGLAGKTWMPNSLIIIASVSKHAAVLMDIKPSAGA